MKTCTKCLLTLDESSFYQETRKGAKRIMARCKACVCAYSRIQQRTLTARRASRRNHQAKVAAGWKPKRWCDKTPEQKRRITEAVKRHRQNNPLAQILGNYSRRMQRAPQFAAAWPVITAHYGAVCLCCKLPERAICADHVVPLNVIDAPALNQISNLQPLCVPCNTSKRRLSLDYRPDKGAWIAELVRLNPTLWIDHSITQGYRIKPIELPLKLPGAPGLD